MTRRSTGTVGKRPAPLGDQLLEHADAFGLPLGGVVPGLFAVHGRVVQLPSGDHLDRGVNIPCDGERVGQQLACVRA